MGTTESLAYFLPELALSVAILAVIFVDLALTVVGASAVILTAGYLLWTLQRMFLGKPNEKYLTLPEINARELFTLVPLGAIVIFLGIYPTPILELQGPALVRLNGQVQEAARAAGDRVADAR